MVVSAAAALLTGSMGTAHADYDRYGSYAVADMGDHWRIGYSLNRPDQAAADSHALAQCQYANCATVVRWVNGCAALVDRDGNLYWGLGGSLVEASRNALAAAGPDPAPFLVSLGSAEPSQATVLDSRCTD
ncbi:DUF4189 domain-containing protein [Nocardia sp. NPDC059240]|uniref:DUF4189 domain-containing protein n=1 Tax=Nocardia sp. NPDC059240 TaxID=3346786 RepID=UPI00367D37EF